MKKIFIKTRNVRNFIGLVEALKSKPKNIPKMGLIYGEPGLGKSQTALWLARTSMTGFTFEPQTL